MLAYGLQTFQDYSFGSIREGGGVIAYPYSPQLKNCREGQGQKWKVTLANKTLQIRVFLFAHDNYKLKVQNKAIKAICWFLYFSYFTVQYIYQE